MVEAHEDTPTQWSSVAGVVTVYPERAQRIAQELWAHFTLCLTGAVRVVFENAPVQEGFESWRRLMKFVRHRGEVRRLELTAKIQKPEPATKVADIPNALERWDTHMREYI